MELIQLVKLALAITYCYAANYNNPFYQSMPNHAMYHPSLHRGGIIDKGMRNFIARPQVHLLQQPMIKPPLNGIQYIKPKFLPNSRPFFKYIKLTKLKHQKTPFKQMKSMYPSKEMKQMKPMKPNNMKYMNPRKISMKPKTPFIYLRTKQKKSYRLPTFFVRRNFFKTRLRFPGVGVYIPPRYQPPRRVYIRRPVPNPPRRPSFQPPPTQNRPPPQYPVRTYNPHPMPPPQTAYEIERPQPPMPRPQPSYEIQIPQLPMPRPQPAYEIPRSQPPMPRQQPVYEIPRVQPPTFNEFPQPQPDSVLNTVEVLPPAMNNVPQFVPEISNEIPLYQPPSGQGVRPQTQFPVSTFTSQPIQPFARPSMGEFVQPKVIQQQRRTRWLQTATGKINNFDDDNDDDSEEKWEKRFEDFDEGLEDLLQKRKNGYYDNDDDAMLDNKIFENFEQMRTLRRNMASSRKYLEDLTKPNGKDRERYFEKSNARSMQQTEQLQSQTGSLTLQPTKSTEERVDRKNKYQENFFEKVGTQVTFRPRQQEQHVNMPTGSNNGITDFNQRQVIYDEKYFENINRQNGQQNSERGFRDIQLNNGNNEIAYQRSEYDKSLPRRNNLGKQNFDRRDPISQQNLQYQEVNNLGPVERPRESFNSRGINNDRNFVDRNQEFYGSFQTDRPYMGDQGRVNNNDRYLEGKRDFADPRSIGFRGSDQTTRQFNEIRNNRNNMRNSDNKYFEGKLEGLPQSSEQVSAPNANNFDKKDFFGDKYIERELNRRIHQQNLRASKPEVFKTVGNRQSKNSNSQEYFEIAENQQTSNRIHRENMQVNRNGMERSSVTQDQVNFVDNSGSVKSAQMIKSRNDNKKFQENKDEFRTIIRRLSKLQKNIDSQREKSISQRYTFSSLSPRA